MFVKSIGGKFILNGRRIRPIGVNKYPLHVSTMSQSDVTAFFSACQTAGITLVRTWCFDAGYLPSDSDGNFRYLDYPLGTNIISNPSAETNTTGYTLGSGYSRSSDTAQDGTWSIKGVQGSGFAEFSIDSLTVSASTDYVYTFWYNVDNISGFPPVTFIKGIDSNTTIKDAGFSSDTNGLWVRKQVLFNSGANTTIQIRHLNWGGNCVSYYDKFNLAVQGTPELASRETTFVHLDMILNEASKYGVKLILSLADNPTYRTKETYISWVNTIYGSGLSTSYPYRAFFDDTNCRQLYKDFIDILTSRVNTINGVTYKNDPTIFSWELGNELRYDLFTSEGGTQNTVNSTNIIAITDWIQDVAGHLHTADPNHMVGFGSLAHTWQYANGDSVSNGSGYGIDYNIHSALPEIDYLDFHSYPTQSGDGSQLQKYGQRLGYPDAISGDGYRAQLQDFVAVGKANGKPVLCGEVGFPREVIASNTYFPLYPRVNAIKEISDVLFDAGADGLVLWHGEITDGGSYSVNFTGTWDGTTTNLNWDDRALASFITTANKYVDLVDRSSSSARIVSTNRIAASNRSSASSREIG